MGQFLVIAAGSTIGQAVVTLLRQQGHQVFTTARDRRRIEPDAILDACDFDAVEAVFQQTGPLDGVVNCAGSLWLKNAAQTNAEQYRAVIDASLTSAFATVRAAEKTMSHGGSVVLISSAAAMVGLANHEAIAAAKGAIISLAKAAAASYAPNNLRFNVVAPGLTETALTTDITQNPVARKISESMHALGRLGTPLDIARAIVFFLDPENAWISGQVLAVDGGLSQLRPKMKA